MVFIVYVELKTTWHMVCDLVLTSSIPGGEADAEKTDGCC